MSSPISGFTAIPNPQMLAFMPIQSYLMMYFAGGGWQIGKRKISAIPNEKFNQMSATELLRNFTADLKESLPVMNETLKEITPLIGVLIEQYGDFIKAAIAATPQAIANIFGGNGESESTLRGQLAAIGATSALGIGARLDDKLIDKIMSAIIASKTVAQQIQNPTVTSPGGIKIPIVQQAPFQGPRIEATTGETTFLPPRDLPEPIGINFTGRPAGQSQIIEKARLREVISKLQIMLGQMTALNRSGNTAAPKVDIDRVRKELNAEKQQLVNLLARYKF